jgi:hypothetical protein
VAGDEAFALPGRWYRGNLHTHTTESDGQLKPEALVRSHKRARYDFVVMTDHWKVTDLTDQSTDEFLIMRGAELDGGKTQVADYHVVGVNLEPRLKRPEQASGQDLVSIARDLGGEAVLCHPSWSGISYEEAAAVDGYIGVEVYNGGCDVEVARGHSMVHWDDLLSRGRRVWGVAADDCHQVAFDLFLGWVMVKAPALTTEAIMEALRGGRFYSSAGPRIEDLRVENGRVRVRCSPVRRIDVVQDPTGKGNCLIAPEAETLTEGTLLLHPRGRYFRIQVTDVAGRMAWTNPVYAEAGA